MLHTIICDNIVVTSVSLALAVARLSFYIHRSY